MKATRELIDGLIAEFMTSRRASADAELGPIETAIFLEDTFGFVMSDREIEELRPDDSGQLSRFVRTKLGA